MTSTQTKFVNRYVRTYLSETPKSNNTFLGLCLITLTISLGLGVLPSLQTVITTRANLATGEIANAQLDKIITDLKTGGANLAKDANKVRLLDEYVPIKDDYGSLVTNFTLLASTSNVNLEFYQKDKAGGTSYWLGASGDYQSIKKFLTAIENGQPLSKIESVTLNIESSKNNQVKSLILVNTYRL